LLVGGARVGLGAGEAERRAERREEMRVRRRRVASAHEQRVRRLRLTRRRFDMAKHDQRLRIVRRARQRLAAERLRLRPGAGVEGQGGAFELRVQAGSVRSIV
jgi:hypothetical protein